MKTEHIIPGNKLISFKTIIVSFIVIIISLVGCNRHDSLSVWKTYRHDGSRTGITGEVIPSQLSLKWTHVPAHAPKPVWNMPAEEMPRAHSDNTYHVSAANGLAYYGSSVDNKVYALDIFTGKKKWVFFTEGPVRFSPTIWNNRIYFGSDDGYVYCLKARTGKMIWKYHPGPKDKKIIGSGRMVSLWPIRTSVLVEDKTVYFGAGVFPYDGLYICALNAKNGSITWKNDDLDDDVFDLEYGGVSPQSYLIASKTKLFVPSGRAMPAVFDRETGKFLHYLVPSGKQGGTWGMLDQGELVAGVDRSGTPTKVSYDIETGYIKTDVYASFTGIDMVGSMDVSYVVTENGVYAIDRIKYPAIQQKIDSVRQEQNRLSGTFRRSAYNAVFADETNFEKQFDEMTSMLNSQLELEKSLKALSSKWFFPQEHLSSIILTGNQVITGGEDIVIGLDRETGEKLWQGNVEGIASGLSVSDQCLIVSTDKGPIYCYSGKSKSIELNKPAKVQKSVSESPYSENKMSAIYKSAAESLLEATSIKKGYCLVLDCGEGELAYELAKRSNLTIIGLEGNKKLVKKAKRILDEAGLYGSRVIVENWTIQSLPDYFADLIVSGDILQSGHSSNPADELFRVLKPGGGVACFGQPEIKNSSQQVLDLESLADEWKSFEIKTPKIISREGNWIMFTRMNLAGAGGWTHQYADPANTSCSDDKLVMAPFSTLWYGSPGPEVMVERHARAAAPVAFDGKLFVEGENIIMAYDSYNGTMLWERKIKGANRVRVDADGGNMAINHHGLFVAVDDKCFQLDIKTGEPIKTFSLPSEWKDKPRRWGYIAIKNNILFGSVSMPLKQEYAQILSGIINENGTWKEMDELTSSDALISEYYKSTVSENTEEVEQAFQRDGTEWRSVADFPAWSPGINGIHSTTERMMTCDGIFAADISTGKTLWTHKGNKIAQIIISIGDETVFFADEVSSQQRLNALNDRQKYIANDRFEPFDVAIPADLADVRNVYALDVLTGKKKWEKAVDLSGCGDDFVASGFKNGVLLFFGSYGLHDKYRFPEGQLKWHRITAVSAENGDLMWSRQLNYMVRPLLINDEIIIEPRKCDLYTGEIKTRILPVTGEQVPWEFYRPGHTCAATSSNEYCLFYRSYNTAYYDLKEDKGLNYYGAIRPGCWINMIPGNGLLLVPESSSGCTCSFPLRTTVVLKPEKNEEVEDWSLYITNGPLTPVKHLAINLGAPGDRKDNNGTIWFGYPRPNMQTGIKFDINENILEGMGFYSYDSKGVKIEGTDYPWLFTNGCFGLQNCEIPLIDNSFGEETGIFTIRLGFVAPSNRRMFDIKIQDNIVLENLDILKEAGSVNHAIIKEFNGIDVKDFLAIELVPEISNPEVVQAPVINFIEVIREDTPDKPVSSEEIRILNSDEARKLLAQARGEQSKKNFDEALGKYHKVLKGTTRKELKIIAFEGMEAIASIESLPEIKKYCQKLNPIMWNYEEPDQELVDAAVKVYVSIARNLAIEDKNMAIKMLNRAYLLASDMPLRYLILSILKDIGSDFYSLPDSSINGLKYNYYEGAWLKIPDFEPLIPIKSGQVFEFGLNEIATRADYFAIRFSGFIKIPVDGKYTFYIKSDDGSKFYIGENLVVDNDGSHDFKEENGQISLKAGKYPVKVEYFDDYAGQLLEVYIKGPGIEKQLVPPSMLFKSSD